MIIKIHVEFIQITTITTLTKIFFEIDAFHIFFETVI